MLRLLCSSEGRSRTYACHPSTPRRQSRTPQSRCPVTAIFVSPHQDARPGVTVPETEPTIFYSCDARLPDPPWFCERRAADLASRSDEAREFVNHYRCVRCGCERAARDAVRSPAATSRDPATCPPRRSATAASTSPMARHTLTRRFGRARGAVVAPRRHVGVSSERSADEGDILWMSDDIPPAAACLGCGYHSPGKVTGCVNGQSVLLSVGETMVPNAGLQLGAVSFLSLIL